MTTKPACGDPNCTLSEASHRQASTPRERERARIERIVDRCNTALCLLEEAKAYTPDPLRKRIQALLEGAE